MAKKVVIFPASRGHKHRPLHAAAPAALTRVIHGQQLVGRFPCRSRPLAGPGRSGGAAGDVQVANGVPQTEAYASQVCRQVLGSVTMGDSKVPCPRLHATPGMRIASSSGARGELCRGRESACHLFPPNLSGIRCSRGAGSDNDSAQTKKEDELRRGSAQRLRSGKKRLPLSSSSRRRVVWWPVSQRGDGAADRTVPAQFTVSC